jgi:hypothetical protein
MKIHEKVTKLDLDTSKQPYLSHRFADYFRRKERHRVREQTLRSSQLALTTSRYSLVRAVERRSKTSYLLCPVPCGFDSKNESREVIYASNANRFHWCGPLQCTGVAIAICMIRLTALKRWIATRRDSLTNLRRGSARSYVTHAWPGWAQLGTPVRPYVLICGSRRLQKKQL